MKLTTTTALQIHQILRQGSVILTAILLAKSSLSTAEIGIYETLLFIGTTFSVFLINGLLQTTIIFYSTMIKEQKEKMAFNIFFVFSCVSVLIFLTLFFLKTPVLIFLTGHADLPYFNLFIVYLLLNLPPFLLESLWTVDNRPLSILGFSVLSNLFLIVAVVLPLRLGMGLEGSLKGMVLVAFVRYILLIINILRTGRWKIDAQIILTFLLMSLPLIIYSTIGSFVTAFSSWLINWHYLGDKEVFAIFRYGAREFPLALALATGLSNSMIPVLRENTEGGLSILKAKSRTLAHILFPISVILMLFTEGVFRLVFNPQFMASVPIFRIYLLLLTSRILFPQSILLALKETKMMLLISVVETMSIIILSFILIYPMGIAGVAWATVLGFLLEKILIIVYLKKKHNIDFRSYTEANWYGFYCFILILSYVLLL